MWAIFTWLLWIVAVPVYLISRRKLIEKARIHPHKISGKNRKVTLFVIGIIVVLVFFNGLFSCESSHILSNYPQASPAEDRHEENELNANESYDGPRILKIKGLYLGMSKNDAITQVDKNSNGMGKPKSDIAYGAIDFATIIWDKNNQICSFEIYPEAFDAREMSGKKFAKEFVNVYNIPSMEGDEWGWEFESNNGYMLEIVGIEVLKYVRVEKRDKLKFN